MLDDMPAELEEDALALNRWDQYTYAMAYARFDQDFYELLLQRPELRAHKYTCERMAKECKLSTSL